ncbi:MAG: hypothetical protein HY391_00290 [Deltaproteobacteria bacterium]|nr:hypothetical protein [Deltaproteobacteria bacterium]
MESFWWPLSISITFAAGCVGGLANSIFVWGMGKSGVSKLMRVQIAPSWTKQWLYPRIVWGGLWGFLFLLPILEEQWLWRGLLFSLGPTLSVLFVVFPYQAKKGFAGLQLGKLTPLFALIANAVWGIAAAWWLK